MTTEIPNRREALVKELASQLTGQHLIAGQWQRVRQMSNGFKAWTRSPIKRWRSVSLKPASAR